MITRGHPVSAPRGTWLFVLPWTLDSIGGVSEVVRNLIRQVDRSGLYQSGMHVLNRAPVPRNGNEASDSAEKMIHFREPARLLESPYRLFIFCLFLIPTLVLLRRRLVNTGVSVVNIHYPGFAVFYFAVARRFRWIDKLVLSFHGADISASAAEVGLRAWLFGWSCRSADALVGCSESLAFKVRTVLRLDRGRVAVVYNGLDEDACIEDMRLSEPVEPGEEVVLCVASYEYKKGIDVLLEAFAEVSPRHPRCRLVMVGRWTPYAELLQLQVARLIAEEPSLAPRIELVQGESHGRILQRMKSARIVVLPSREEPFGIVILESGFVGVPVVATSVGGIPEIVDDGVSGLLVPSNDKTALAEACDRMLRDPGLRKHLADALALRVRERFTWSAAWQRYVALTSSTASSTR